MSQIQEQAPVWQSLPIYGRPDDSFVIHNPYPFHVYPHMAEFAGLWDEVVEYLEANGITPEPEPLPPPPPSPTEEEKAGEVRRQRNALLNASDYVMVTDYPITPEKRGEWAAYRQALRDVTGQAGFPDAVEWPVMPEASV